jgi:ADP-L-glycero-D-manno-heptose 6-epimerase
MIVVTGAAGFIGSALVQALNQRGRSDILIIDDADHAEKRKNLDALRFARFQGKDAFLAEIKAGTPINAEAVLHMGACSSTTETDADYLNRNNFEYTRELAEYCAGRGIRFIYASSAATYGNGERGYADDESLLETLQPLNLYGESKQKFDRWAKEKGLLKSIVGLKYFNAYGPNEYHKGDMQSMVRKGFFQVRETGRLRLFKSHRPEYADGGQCRDFVYIKDAVAMTLFFLDRLDVGGLFNVGTGTARTWNDLARALFSACGLPVNVEYVEMPEAIRDHYQYRTCATMEKIRRAGYSAPITALEDGVGDYVRNYLMTGKRLGLPFGA